MLGNQVFNRNTDKAIERHNILVEQADKMKEDEDEDISYLIKPSGRVRHLIIPSRRKKGE